MLFEDFTIRVPSEREELFVRLMFELGFEILAPELPTQQPFSLLQIEKSEEEPLSEAIAEAENDIQNGHYLFTDEVRNLVKTWKKSV